MKQQICTYRGPHDLQEHGIADLQVLYMWQAVKSRDQESHVCVQMMPEEVLGDCMCVAAAASDRQKYALQHMLQRGTLTLAYTDKLCCCEEQEVIKQDAWQKNCE